MASNFRIKIDVGGFNTTRRSGDIQAFLDEAAERIAAEANQEVRRPNGEDFVVHSEPNSTRARSVVVAASIQARLAESRTRALSRALDAGR